MKLHVRTREDIARAKEQRKKLLTTILVRLLILLLLLTPTYIAIASYASQKNAPVEDNLPVFDAIRLTGPSGKEIPSLAEGDTLLSVFLPLFGNTSKTDSIPPSHREGAYTAVMKSGHKEEIYTFYFAPYSTDCYYTTPAGETFLSANNEKTATFLNSAYSYELYEGAKLPTLSTAVTDAVAPSLVSWHYRTKNGTFSALTQASVAGDTLTYPIAANDVVFHFSTAPDVHEITIKHRESVLYSGTVDGISLSIEEDMDLLDVEISATYHERADRDFYGSISYRFRMEMVEAADFIPSAERVQVGGYFIVRCENVNNTDKLTIKASPANITPVLFARGDLIYIAFPADEAGSHTLQITYGTITKSFELVATAPSGVTHTPDKDTLGTDYVALLGTALPALIAEKGADTAGMLVTDGTKIPNGKFAVMNAPRIFSYGDVLAPDGAAPMSLPFSLYRIGGSVAALSAGRVLEVGEREDIGKYVILDHGCGLYTWYAGLGELRTHTGAILRAGDTVGVASTKLHTESSALIMATLGKKVLSVEQLAANGFVWKSPVMG